MFFLAFAVEKSTAKAMRQNVFGHAVRPSVRPSVNCLSVCPWRDAIVSEWISMKLGMHIHRVSGHCWKVFQGQRSKVKVTIRRQTLQLCVASPHLFCTVLHHTLFQGKFNDTYPIYSLACFPSPFSSSPLSHPSRCLPFLSTLHSLHLSPSLRSRYPLFQLYAPQARFGRITAEIDFCAFLR